MLSHGLHYASAVFEGERAYGGEIFALDQHSQRLYDGAKTMDFTIPYSVAEIEQACRDTVKANKLGDCYVRPIAWRGSEMMGVSAQATKNRPISHGFPACQSRSNSARWYSGATQIS